MREQLLGGFCLGEYRIEPLTGKISGPVGARHVAPKAMEILLCLAADARSMITREELLRAVWGETAGSQEALSHAVSELRHALGDRPNDPKFIQTLPRRGYRLLVPATIGSVPATGTRQSTAGQRVGFFGEMKRRGVIETAIAYLVVGWLLIQIAAATFDQLPLPPWSVAFVTYLVIVGFPIALLLAWCIRITAKGAVLELDSDSIPEHKAFSRPYIAVLGALALAAAGVFVYEHYVGLPRVAAGTDEATAATKISVDPSSIAVLPFLNIGGTENGRVFAEGLAEDVMNRLAKVPGLEVSSRGDAFSLPPNASSTDVRRRLRVAYYLEGSVRVLGSSLRVVVQLINSKNGFHVVSRGFNRPLKDFFAIQHEITDLTVANLRVALPAETQLSVEPDPDDGNLDAYVLYRRGMEALEKPMTKETITEALDQFRRALGVDRDYAAAHAGICMTYASGYRVTKDPAYISKAEKSCAEALSLNSNLDVVHNALGELYARTGRYAEAEAAFQRALAINHKAVDSLIGLGDVYENERKIAQAERTFRRAIGLQPGNWQAYNALGGFFFDNGRYREAAKEYREVVSLDEGNGTGWTNLGASLELSGDFAEAAQATQRAIDIDPTAIAYANLGLLHYYLGDLGAAADSLQHAVDIAPNDSASWSNLGDVLVSSGQPKKARRAFEQAERLAENQLQINGKDAETIYHTAWIKAVLGKFDEADKLMTTARAIAPDDPYVPYTDALILVRRGNSTAALGKLERAAKMGYPLALMAAEPQLNALKDDARFQALVRKQ